MIRKTRLYKSGQAALEFAFVSIFLLMIIFGIFDLGRAIFYYSNLSNAAREGARYGTVHNGDIAGIKAQICRLSVGMDLGCPFPPSTTLLIDTYENAYDEPYIKVHLRYMYTPLTPLIALFIEGNQISLHVESTMRIEGVSLDE